MASFCPQESHRGNLVVGWVIIELYITFGIPEGHLTEILSKRTRTFNKQNNFISHWRKDNAGLCCPNQDYVNVIYVRRLVWFTKLRQTKPKSHNDNKFASHVKEGPCYVWKAHELRDSPCGAQFTWDAPNQSSLSLGFSGRS